MANRTIDPNRVYTTTEAAKAVGTSVETMTSEIDKRLVKAKKLGKGWKILGSNLLTYISSPTVEEPGKSFKQLK